MSKPIGLLPMTTEPQTPRMFRSLSISASGLSAQRERMENIASNIANAETTHGADGAPYKRRVTVLATGDGQGSFPQQMSALSAPSAASTDGPVSFQVPVLETRDAMGTTSLTGDGAGVHVAGVQEDNSQGQLVYDPGHPDADKNGYVRYPNVRITDEMVDMMDARRVYEANASVFQSAKAMVRQALDI